MSYLDTKRPTHHTICGIDLAVWRDGNGQWSALSDMCPHRCRTLVATKPIPCRPCMFSVTQYPAPLT